MVAQVVLRRGGAGVAAIRWHAPLFPDADQTVRRHRGRSARAAPAASLRPYQVRDVESRIPILCRRACCALDATTSASVRRAGGIAVMTPHEEWVQQIDA